VVEGPGSIKLLRVVVVGSLARYRGADPPDHEPVEEYQREAVRACVDAPSDLMGWIVGLARGDVVTDEVQRLQSFGGDPFGGEAGGHPVQLAESVVVGVEAEQAKRDGGARAHVAHGVPAVHDHGLPPLERVRAPGGELLQGDVDRPREMDS
jgi:hypothetical protein